MGEKAMDVEMAVRELKAELAASEARLKEANEQLTEQADAIAMLTADVDRHEQLQACGEGTLLQMGFPPLLEDERLPEGYAYNQSHVDVSLDAERQRTVAAILRGMIESGVTVRRYARGGSGGRAYPVRTPQDALCAMLDLVEFTG